MGLLDNNNRVQGVYLASKEDARLKTIASLQDFDIKAHIPTDSYSLMAVYNDIAVFTIGGALQISESGVNGTLTKVTFNSTNFPNLIDGSRIERVMIVPYSRSSSYSGEDWRLCVFTNKGQIYHNFPNRSTSGAGTSQDGDIYKFDESVVWDSVDRKYPVKTTSGTDATLIATGKYRYCPCLPDSMYEMYPALNTDNGYNNGGFGAVREYTDQDGTTKKRARFWYPIRTQAQANSFQWISGCIQDKQMSMIATYLSDTTYQPRLCVFATNDGREWFVQWECGADGKTIAKDGNSHKVVNNPSPHFSEFGDSSLRISFGTNSMSSANAFTVRSRMQWVPNDEDKEPEKTHKFMYGNAIAISSIASDSSNGIVVTTASAHGFSDGEVVVIDKVNGDSTWNWIASEDETEMSSGNGVIWKAQVLSTTTFRLMLELKSAEENLPIRHIHSINRCKDGYVIGCGEEYPRGWVLYIYVPQNDSYANLFAGNGYPVYRLTSSPSAIQRILGLELTQEEGSVWYSGVDTASIVTDNVTFPSGRTVQMCRNSTGIYKGTLAQIDDFSEAQCVCEVEQPAYFFKEVNGIMVFVGMRGALVLSKDRFKTYTRFALPPELYAVCWLLGTDSQKRIYIRYFASAANATLVIEPKV